jgi:DNA-binding NarL/FixJ family response regulator
MKKKLKVLIVDDQQLFADGLSVVIESRAPQIKVVGIANNGIQAINLTKKLQPDVILMDVRMPEMDGVVATRTIHQKYPDIKILILTTFDDDEYVRHSLKNGAIGYLLKSRPAEELIDSIQALAKGIIQIDSAVSAKILDASGSVSEDKSDDFYKRLTTLTNRECEILRLLVMAKRIVNIAKELQIAEQTVRNHISNIYFKLNIHDRLEIINYINQIQYFLNQIE